MNTIKLNLAIILILSFLTGCGSNENKTAGENSGSETKTGQMESKSTQEGEEIVVLLPTMQCGMCKKTIEKEVKKLDGVNDVNVVVKEKVAKVRFDKSKTDVSSIEGVIVAAGYQANDKPADKEAYEKLDDCCKIGGH